MRRILAIDQGTTSTRAILFDAGGRARAMRQKELPQVFPRSGWVEQDPRRIWEDTLEVSRAVIREAGLEPEHLEAIGITNQRETTVLWERSSGRPVHHALVWQDRRTAGLCRRLADEGHEEALQERTGLVLDPYFSASKLAWLLENVEGARTAAERGELAFGTVDTWLLWHLTGGRRHVTDVTNASRTLLFDIHRQVWDPEALELFGIPAGILPEVLDSSGPFGETDPDLFGRAVPITGVAGDQQAATFGQAAFEPGTMKSTYGTGAFLLLNTGREPLRSHHRLLTTIAWRIAGRTTYALEGSIFSAGATVQWLRDGLGLIREAAETEALAASVEDTDGVYLVPGFVGLGAPHWDADARGALLGLSRDTSEARIARAALEAVAYQTMDLLTAMEADGADAPVTLRVDGGLAANDFAMGFLSDIVRIPVERPEVGETTALGAASLAGLETGFYPNMDTLARNWRRDRRWTPDMSAEDRDRRYAGWKRALARVLTPPGTPPA